MSKFRTAFKNHATKASCSGLAADGVRETIRLVASNVAEITPEAYAKAAQIGLRLGQGLTIEVKGEAKKLSLTTEVVGKEATGIVEEWFGIEAPKKKNGEA